jgi:hypothetical protein
MAFWAAKRPFRRPHFGSIQFYSKREIALAKRALLALQFRKKIECLFLAFWECGVDVSYLAHGGIRSL